MSKQGLICGVVMSFLLMLPAASQARSILDNAPKGFTNNQPSSNPSTVAGVYNNAYDGDLVVLQGRLIKFLGHERYEFADHTGRIEVELDDDHDWSFLSRDELIQITGIVDSSIFSKRVDVKQALSLEKTLDASISAQDNNSSAN